MTETRADGTRGERQPCHKVEESGSVAHGKKIARRRRPARCPRGIDGPRARRGSRARTRGTRRPGNGGNGRNGENGGRETLRGGGHGVGQWVRRRASGLGGERVHEGAGMETADGATSQERRGQAEAKGGGDKGRRHKEERGRVPRKRRAISGATQVGEKGARESGDRRGAPVAETDHERDEAAVRARWEPGGPETAATAVTSGTAVAAVTAETAVTGAEGTRKRTAAAIPKRRTCGGFAERLPAHPEMAPTAQAASLPQAPWPPPEPDHPAEGV